MDIQITHCLLVNSDVENFGLKNVEYYESKFPREIGDRIINQGQRLIIGAIGDSKDIIIKKANELISIQKKLTKQKRKNDLSQFDSMWLSDSEIKNLLKF